ncbi:hypothetical protein [Streptomyces sp. NPDC029041]|uniref:hypothetical protein n=1 Tax=Streptomyces sp. NPDC029041 TaxID=3155727 RepID=UPI00340F2395
MTEVTPHLAEVAAAVQEHRVAGMWIPDASGGSRWVDEEMPYGEHLAVLHLQPAGDHPLQRAGPLPKLWRNDNGPSVIALALR